MHHIHAHTHAHTHAYLEDTCNGEGETRGMVDQEILRNTKHEGKTSSYHDKAGSECKVRQGWGPKH